MLETIMDYEIIVHGLENEQYFQGCGISLTSFHHVVTGIGDNPAEAIDDCLEQIAMNHSVSPLDMFEQRMLVDEKLESWPLEPIACDYGDDCEDCDEHMYISIRYNLNTD